MSGDKCSRSQPWPENEKGPHLKAYEAARRMDSRAQGMSSAAQSGTLNLGNCDTEPFTSIASWGLIDGASITTAKLVPTEGAKYDSEKPRLDLVDAIATEGLAKVLTFGAKKYAANNWRGGIAFSRVLAGLERHLLAIKRGEDIDPESGLPHIDHLGCCWMFLSNFMKTRPDLDDRWKPK